MIRPNRSPPTKMMEDLFNADLDLDFDVDSSSLDFLPDDFEFEFTEEDLDNFDESIIPDLAALIRLEEEDEAAEAAAAVAAVAAIEKAEQTAADEMEFTYDLELEANTFFTDENQFSNNFSNSLKDNSFKDNLLKECAVLNDLLGLNDIDGVNNGVSSASSAIKTNSFAVAQSTSSASPTSSVQLESQLLEYDSGIESNGCTPAVSPAPSSIMSSKDAFDSHPYFSDGSSLDGSNSGFDLFPSVSSTTEQQELTFGGFESYYALDQDNNLVRQPLNSLTPDEINSLTAAFAGAGVAFKPDATMPTLPTATSTSAGTLVSSQRRRKRTKGVSLLAKPPKSLKVVKREIEQSKMMMSQPLKTIEINTTITPVQTPLLHQDHDYCSEVRVLN